MPIFESNVAADGLIVCKMVASPDKRAPKVGIVPILRCCRVHRVYYEEAKGHIDARAIECHACRKAKKGGPKLMDK